MKNAVKKELWIVFWELKGPPGLWIGRVFLLEISPKKNTGQPNPVRVETVRRFTTPPKKTYEEDGEATPTKKVKLKYVNDAYQDLIKAMYR